MCQFSFFTITHSYSHNFNYNYSLCLFHNNTSILNQSNIYYFCHLDLKFYRFAFSICCLFRTVTPERNEALPQIIVIVITTMVHTVLFTQNCESVKTCLLRFHENFLFFLSTSSSSFFTVLHWLSLVRSASFFMYSLCPFHNDTANKFEIFSRIQRTE